VGFRGTAIAALRRVIVLNFPTERARVKNPMAIDHQILTVKEVSELLRVNPSTVYRLTKEGRIPAFKIGTDWRFRKDQMVHWIAEQTIRAAQ
jgi:excisionase family DNA binding protein